jgi:hypothetical protein
MKNGTDNEGRGEGRSDAAEGNRRSRYIKKAARIMNKKKMEQTKSRHIKKIRGVGGGTRREMR